MKRIRHFMIRILYSDPQMLICEKPVGVSSESPGLPDLVNEQTGLKTYPVHRLDQGTGGVCILALSPRMCSALQSIFRNDMVLKDYFAVVSGRPENDCGQYNDLLFHDRRQNKTFIARQMRKGVKEASCDWSVVRSVVLDEQTLSLVHVRLHTGRTHQIRVQFASRGFPLAGDKKYGSRIKGKNPALWAGCISLPHPDQPGLSICASSRPPAVFPWDCFPDDVYDCIIRSCASRTSSLT